MKKICSLIMIFLLTYHKSSAQKVYLEKQASIDAIEKAGSTIKYFDNDKSVFYYNRYDEIGETQVIYKAEDDVIKEVRLVCRDQRLVAKRALEAFRTASSAPTVDKDIEGVFIATGTVYYDGKARYEGKTEYRHNENYYYLEIIILDPKPNIDLNAKPQQREYRGQINVLEYSPILAKPDMEHQQIVVQAVSGVVTIIRKENEKFYYVRYENMTGYLWVGWIK